MNTWHKLESNLESYWDILILNIPRIAVSVLILSGFVLLASLLGKFFRAKMRRRATDSITANFVIRISKFIIIVFGVMLAFHALGMTGIAGGLLAGAGASAVIIGFAFKEIGENFLAGIILIFDRPFNIGNTVTIEESTGVVKGLGFRTTHLKTFEGKDIYVPNSSVIRNNVTNHTQDGLLRHEFKLPVSKEMDLDKTLKIVYAAVQKHTEVLKSEKTQVLIEELAKDETILKILFWIETKDYKYHSSSIKSEIMQSVKVSLDSQKTSDEKK